MTDGCLYYRHKREGHIIPSHNHTLDIIQPDTWEHVIVKPVSNPKSNKESRMIKALIYIIYLQISIMVSYLLMSFICWDYLWMFYHTVDAGASRFFSIVIALAVFITLVTAFGKRSR